MDATSLVRDTAALAVRIASWLRDEEAAGSNPATPTRKKQVIACLQVSSAGAGTPVWETFGRRSWCRWSRRYLVGTWILRLDAVTRRSRTVAHSTISRAAPDLGKACHRSSLAVSKASSRGSPAVRPTRLPALQVADRTAYARSAHQGLTRYWEVSHLGKRGHQFEAARTPPNRPPGPGSQSSGLGSHHTTGCSPRPAGGSVANAPSALRSLFRPALVRGKRA